MTAPPRVTNGAAGLPFFGTMPSLEHEITDFQHDVIERSQGRVVVAEFWAPWCRSCAQLRTSLERAHAHEPGRFELVAVNIEMHPEVITDYGVHGLPLAKIYWHGQAAGELAGVVPDEQVAQWLDRVFADLAEAGFRPAAAAPPAAPVVQERKR